LAFGAQRVTSAIRYPGTATSGTPQRSDTYSYDVASNRLSQAVALNGGAPTTTNYSYDDANRLSNAGFAYDNAGRMTSDGTNTYTWDRANRLLSMGSSSYAYNGAGHRVSQTIGANTTRYTLDVSMGLWETLVETTGANATRYIHDARGLLSQQRPDASWQWAMSDGLGSVRGMLNSSQSQQDSRVYAPHGEATQLSGTSQSGYGYTGEPTDGNGLVYLRNRYYAPGLGVFASVDPLETANRYAYVGGNVVNRVDPSGLLFSAGSNVGGACARGQVRNSAGKCITTQTMNPNPQPWSPPVKTVIPSGGGSNTQHGNNNSSPASNGGDEYLPPDQQAFSVSQYANGEVQTVITGNSSTVLGSQGCPPQWRAIVRGRTTVCERMNGIGGGQLTPQDAWADYAIDQRTPPPMTVWDFLGV
jgi:RHS repeat-associated protein